VNQINSTQKHIREKQTRTTDEIARDLTEQEEATAAESSSDDEDKPIYNPLNLPLGWDGKPIPYWLYKLHGLNIEYKCQICGGYSYWGPRAFERHFKEWRHAYGMRCLGIPNTKHFMNITKFEDAKALWEKIQKEDSQREFRAEEEEEFEDHDGIVHTKKIYEDLKRQVMI